MTETTPPPGVIPHLVCKNATAAIDFYKAAFDATERMRLPGKDGLLMHAALTINGGLVMLVDEFPDMTINRSPAALGGTSVTLHLYVPDARAAIAKAIAAGATMMLEPQEMFWGDLYGMVVDPFGHVWSIATPGQPKTAAEIAAAMQEA